MQQKQLPLSSLPKAHKLPRDKHIYRDVHSAQLSISPASWVQKKRNTSGRPQQSRRPSLGNAPRPQAQVQPTNDAPHTAAQATVLQSEVVLEIEGPAGLCTRAGTMGLSGHVQGSPRRHAQACETAMSGKKCRRTWKRGVGEHAFQAQGQPGDRLGSLRGSCNTHQAGADMLEQVLSTHVTGTQSKTCECACMTC